MKEFFKKHRSTLLAVLAIACFYAVLFALGITCPIKGLFGVSCPGCGMSRACISACRLDFGAAFYYHPLWVLLLPYATAFVLLMIKKKKKALRALIYAGAFLLIAVYVYRMIVTEGDVVVAEPQNGLFGRLFSTVFGEAPT